MKQGLQLKFSQNLSLTPQLQQAIRLLQLSTLELNQEIELLMQANPLLERGDAGEDEYGNATDNSADEVTLNTSSDHDDTTHENANDSSRDYDQDSGQNDTPNDAQNSTQDSLQDTDVFGAEFSERSIESKQNESTSSESSPKDEPAEFQAEFNDEFDEFSNGSRWDENSTPSDDDSDFKQQETLQLS